MTIFAEVGALGGPRLAVAHPGGFFDGPIWILVLVPTLAVILLAALKRKSSPELPHVTDLTWRVDVDESEIPVVVHAYKAWSVGDRVIENQVIALRDSTPGTLAVYWLDIDKNPGIVGRFRTLERRSVALFRNGALLWQVVGVHDHRDMLREFAEALGVSEDTLARRVVEPSESQVL